jgi:hypothetical protein
MGSALSWVIGSGFSILNLTKSIIGSRNAKKDQKLNFFLILAKIGVRFVWIWIFSLMRIRIRLPKIISLTPPNKII